MSDFLDVVELGRATTETKKIVGASDFPHSPGAA